MAAPPDESFERLELFSGEALEQLTQGFLAVFQPELARVHHSLEELTSNQEDMLQSVHKERLAFEESTVSADILNTLQKVPHYRQKLVSLSKQMHTIDKRVKRLQQRASKLKEVRSQRDQQRRREYERRLQHERMLEARPSAK